MIGLVSLTQHLGYKEWTHQIWNHFQSPLVDMKFLTGFFVLFVAVALINGQKDQNENKNVIHINNVAPAAT